MIGMSLRNTVVSRLFFRAVGPIIAVFFPSLSFDDERNSQYTGIFF